jgi:AraC family transcriptional regulator of adaptative response/methylated-DNA-[protein]-cysteine methyltransferase
LGALSRRTGLSPNYVHETFKRIVGVTPKGYHDTRRIDSFKKRLRQGESIAVASYATGYGSSRALYESARKVMGMTPAVFRRGGDLRMRVAVIKRPFDLVLVAGTQMGLCAVLQGKNQGNMFRELRLEFPKADLVHESSPPAGWITVVRSCSCEDPFISKLPDAIRDQIYRAKVLLAQPSG